MKASSYNRHFFDDFGVAARCKYCGGGVVRAQRKYVETHLSTCQKCPDDLREACKAARAARPDDDSDDDSDDEEDQPYGDDERNDEDEDREEGPSRKRQRR